MEINKIIHELNKLGEDWADKNSAADLLEETQKSVLSQCLLGFEGSLGEREAKARDSATYRHHVCLMVDARKNSNIAKVRYESFKTKIDLVRTNQANKRQELKALGG